MDIRGYIRQARTLPLGTALRKAAALVDRAGHARVRLAADMMSGSYGMSAPGLNPAARIAIAAADVPADLQATLLTLSRAYLAHRFDLLGSGWVVPAYRSAPPGFLGRCYPAAGPAPPARDGAGLEAIVNRANVARARQIWCLIARPDYEPIDWQLDFRSGYRWSAQRPSLRLRIPVNTGADIKVPWELARLQHLPQLALCAVLAKDSVPGFAPPSRYVGEIADQLADFLATNPPRFGVNWMGTMDVAIRAANIALTLVLLAGTDLALSPAMSAVVASALHDHATHVAEHLEYSETGRSNHYLADLGGLLWAGWALADADADRFLAFAIAEIVKEADHQFLADGGNYEGSTNYHRLSGEIIVFALTAIGSLDTAALKRLERASPPARSWRVAFPALPLRRYRDNESGAGLIPPTLLQKLQGAARLTRAVQGADDTIVQIGDTDSGRMFKLHPTGSEGEGGFAENTLDHRGFAAAVEALCGAAPTGRMDAVIVKKMLGDANFEALAAAPVMADVGNLAALMARWQAAPEKARRVRRFPLNGSIEPASWSRAAFADFGLYVFRHGDKLIAFRCAAPPPKTAPRGHRHDDNLAVEVRLGAAERRDPGSYVYTPSVATRNAYRSADAHDVPRRHGEVLAAMTGLFDLEEAAYARCLDWGADGVGGEVRALSGPILRIVHLSRDELTIFDCVEGGELADVPPPLPVAQGYGRL